MSKISGILYILNELDKGTIRTKDIAEKLEVAPRTVQRYINEIEKAKIPIESVKLGEYRFQNGYSLSKMQLTKEEAGLIVLMENFFKSIKNSVLSETLQKLKIKTEDVTPYDLFYIKLLKSVKYPANNITKTLQDCILTKHCVSIKYRDKILKGVKPLKIVLYDGFWYLVGLGFNNLILKFRISDIKQAKDLKEKFEINKNIKKILEDSKNIWFEDKRPEEVKIHINKSVARYFKLREYFPLQKIVKENKDGSLDLTCKINRFEELKEIMFPWIPYIKVVSPTHIKDKIKELILVYYNQIK